MVAERVSGRGSLTYRFTLTWDRILCYRIALTRHSSTATWQVVIRLITSFLWITLYLQIPHRLSPSSAFLDCTCVVLITTSHHSSLSFPLILSSLALLLKHLMLSHKLFICVSKKNLSAWIPLSGFVLSKYSLKRRGCRPSHTLFRLGSKYREVGWHSTCLWTTL
uniref:Uncharacterized protein n=1 Tax=Parascaris univalens TaxID=6257 RepID=A0A915ABR3_PARUN